MPQVYARYDPEMGREFIFLVKVTSMVSNIGTAKINDGTKMVKIRPETSFCVPIKASAANTNPKKRLPQSPMKILAGLKLYLKNPKALPAKIIAIKAD